ncbi:MAG: hypothetical protein ACUVXA_09965 [Candidatus Jordarchaeum sp.]|uniref:hypothetical protein n=1 Tax=Candidatus Jordarchaeum sp. TaxID=2823881 RepID=UPI00404A01DD
MSSSRKYTTIPVLVEVKEVLDKIRKGREWSKFLAELVEENKRLKRKVAARSLQKRFNTVVEHISDSYQAFRQGFKLKDSIKDGTS